MLSNRICATCCSKVSTDDIFLELDSQRLYLPSAQATLAGLTHCLPALGNLILILILNLLHLLGLLWGDLTPEI